MGADVFEYCVENGYEDECDEGGEGNAEGEADGHGHEEFSLKASFEEHGCEAAEGGGGGEQDRSESLNAGLDEDFAEGESLGLEAVDEIDHDE